MAVTLAIVADVVSLLILLLLMDGQLVHHIGEIFYNACIGHTLTTSKPKEKTSVGVKGVSRTTY